MLRHITEIGWGPHVFNTDTCTLQVGSPHTYMESRVLHKANHRGGLSVLNTETHVYMDSGRGPCVQVMALVTLHRQHSLTTPTLFTTSTLLSTLLEISVVSLKWQTHALGAIVSLPVKGSVASRDVIACIHETQVYWRHRLHAWDVRAVTSLLAHLGVKSFTVLSGGRRVASHHQSNSRGGRPVAFYLKEAAVLSASVKLLNIVLS